MTRLFVGGLHPSLTEEALTELFGKYGPLKDCFLIVNRETGASRGFGFIEYKDPLDAGNAQRSLNGTELNGRKIKVQEATERRTKDA